MYLQKENILELIQSGQLIIRPLLDESKQINEMSIDLRLGYDFLVAIQGREPFIDATRHNENVKPIQSFFQETRRRLGDTFILHPNQTVLTTSLEYIKLPSNVYAIVTMRSSFARLGMMLSTIVQPGYSGCVSLELTNLNRNPINITVGSRIVQVRLAKLENPSNYFNQHRKYICNVRPEVSAANKDGELDKLRILWENNNHRVN